MRRVSPLLTGHTMSIHRLVALGLGLTLVLALAAAGASAQSLYGVDGAGTTAMELTGPSTLPCGYPNGPVLLTFPYIQPTPCTPMQPYPTLPPSVLGDITTNRKSDHAFLSDGKNIGEYTAAGVLLNVMSVGTLGISAVTGLGFDTALGRLWVSDGAMIYAMTPSAPGSCLPPVINSAFAPAGLGFVTDVSWHSPTGVLYACDVAGMIAGYSAAGVLVAGPWAQAASGCPLGLPLVGIAADTSSACPGGLTRLWVTDGLNVDYQFVGGVPAPAKFYSPFNCYPWSSAPTQGLEYVARPIDYGTGTGPVIGAAGGQSVLPNPLFKITLTGGPPGGQAYLLYGSGAPCPPFNFFGNPWYINPWFAPLGPFPISATGTFTLNAPLPAPGGSVPCGTSIHMQWLCRSTTLVWTTSQGLEFTASIP